MRSESPRLMGRWLFVALVFLLAIPAVAPLTFPGSIQSLNGLNAVYNVMDLNARLGTCCWSPAFARGVDLFRADGVLPYAAADFFYRLGLGALDSVKLVYGLGLVLSGLGMFALARRTLGSEAAGLLAAVLYVYFPYHLALVYIRGAFGEATFWAVAPLAVLAWARLRTARTPGPADFVAVTLAFALAALALPGLGLLLALLTPLGLEILLRSERWDGRISWRGPAAISAGALVGLAPQLLATVTGVVNASFRFVPAYVQPFQLLTAAWGAEPPRADMRDDFPFQLGVAALGLALFALVLAWQASPYGERDKARARRITLVAAGLAALVCAAVMPFAAPLWGLAHLDRLVEYPFELFSFVGLALAMVGASAVVLDKRMAQTALLGTLVAIPILAVYPYLAPNYYDFSPIHPPLAIFNDNEIALLDATVVRPPGIIKHGATVEVAMEWQALRQVNHDYTVFVHAVDENGKSWGGHDGKLGGDLSTLKWKPGQLVKDSQTIKIDIAGPPEGYRLEIGIYTAATGQRAPTETGETQVLIAADGEK